MDHDGKTALLFDDDEESVAAAARALATTARTYRLATLTIEQVNGAVVFGTPTGAALRAAGFVESTRGLTLRRLSAGELAREGARA